ncbi:MAG: cation diffusion facilitator family transporter [Anaerolineae bacterium]|nr:cation diffusion facilitator family transporter [Anaerolineae bacterium]
MTDVHVHHDHHHDHDHNHDHHHHEGGNLLTTIAAALHLPGYTHEHSYTGLAGDSAMQDNQLGIRTVKYALLALGITTVLQVIIYIASGSVALLADTVHNLGDALNSIPLWIAFVLARRPPNKRYTYGYGRAEDVAGLFIVVSIAFSAAYIMWESIQKLINPQPLENLGWVALAALIGFAGNEIVALMQIRVGRKIGSEAMVADGLHARTDGLTSLAVLIAVAGTLLGFPIIDPIIGLVIGLAIVGITWGAMKSMWYRLMNAVDPHLVEETEKRLQEHPEVKQISRLQMQWIGHRLHVEMSLKVDESLSLTQGDELRHHLAHHLEHDLPNFGGVTIELTAHG